MKVKIDFIFSKSSKIGSKFLSWGTRHLSKSNKDFSHSAILVGSRWVIESTLESGVRVTPYKKWLEDKTKTFRVEGPKMDYSEVKKEFKRIKNKGYDWIGVLYFGFFIALNKYFNKPIPKNNKWENPDKYFCTEAVSNIANLKDCSMKSPVQLIDDLLEH